jgi:hypothetical protein
MSIFKNNFVVGITAALAATIIAPVLVPAIKKGSRPVAKSLIRGGIALYEKGRETVASAGEAMEDLVAEAQAEELEKRFATAGNAAAGSASEDHHAAAARGGDGGSRLSSVRAEGASMRFEDGGAA